MLLTQRQVAAQHARWPWCRLVGLLALAVAACGESDSAAETCDARLERLEQKCRVEFDEAAKASYGREHHEWERAEAAAERARSAEARVRQCNADLLATSEVMRKQLAEALGKEHQRELAAERERLEKAHQRELKKALKAGKKREWQLKEALEANARRADHSEARLRGMETGSDLLAAEGRARVLAEEADAAERARLATEAASLQQAAQASEREAQLRWALGAAEAAAAEHRRELQELRAVPAPHAAPAPHASPLSGGLAKEVPDCAVSADANLAEA